MNWGIWRSHGICIYYHVLHDGRELFNLHITPHSHKEIVFFLFFFSCSSSRPLAKLEVARAAISLSIYNVKSLYSTRLASFFYRQQQTSSSFFRVWKKFEAVSQKVVFHSTFSASPHRRWTSLILSADLQIPLQLQSNEATQMFPA